MLSIKVPFCFLLSFAICCSSIFAEEKLNAEHRFVFEMCKLDYNEQELTIPALLSDWTKILGPYDRKVVLANDIYVWDELGMTIQTRWDKNEILSLNFRFDQSRHAVSRKDLKYATSEERRAHILEAIAARPTKFFQDGFLLDGVLMHKGNTIEPINHKRYRYYRKHYLWKPGEEIKYFQQSYNPIVYRYNRSCRNGFQYGVVLWMITENDGPMETFTLGFSKIEDSENLAKVVEPEKKDEATLKAEREESLLKQGIQIFSELRSIWEKTTP